MAGQIRVGTCSWADEALSKHFYPPGMKAGERLPYYAEHFDTVELDSTYYRLPVESMAARWAEQTPDGFVMHVKAFGVMTRHPVKKEQLPTDLREAAPVDEKGRVDRPPREFRAEVFTRYREALEPLRAAGKLGGTLFQFPPYVVYKDLSLDYLAWAREQMGDDEMLVEFRHSSWYEEDVRDEVLSFLEEHGMSLVVVDAPKVEAKNVPRTLLAVTGPTVYVRFHGRNEKTWNARGGSAAERFDYLYTEDELREWVEPLRELAGQAQNAYAFFNNNNRSPGDGGYGGFVAQGAANAQMLKGLLTEAGVPA
ncbi:MAG TPA: DUF72 domain-containing protein [Gaiellaceae bacterium]|nr:DUF72 domain-containing protein [Gaiellaceae bacterium]